DLGYVYQQAGGNFLFSQGTSSNPSACANSSILSSVVVDNSGSSTAQIAITADTDVNGTAGDPAWSGTVPALGHLDDTMDGGLFAGGPLAITVSGSGVHWYLYGVCFRSSASSRFQQRILRSHRMMAGR